MTALQQSYYRRRAVGFARNHSETIETVIILLFFLLVISLLPHFTIHADSQVAGSSAEIKKVIVTPTPTPKPLTDKEYMLSLPYGKLVWQTYGHESSYGKNDGCLSQGLYNGFGFGEVTDNTYVCYGSIREVAKHVSDWFVEHQDLGVVPMLCLYNTGKALNDCGYAEYTLAL